MSDERRRTKFFSGVLWAMVPTLAFGLVALSGCDAADKSSESKASSGEDSEDEKSDDDDPDDDSSKKKKKGDKKKSKKKSKKTSSEDGDDEKDGDEGGGFEKASVEAGELGDVWTGAFEARRVDGDTGLDYLKAAANCRAQSMNLCTEVQWQRVCEADEGLGKLESWTASWSGDGVVVRGGSGCGKRAVAPGGKTSKDRAGVCCSRAIGLKGSNTDIGFRSIAHTEQLTYEVAHNDKDVGKLAKLWDEELVFDGKPMANKAAASAQKSFFKGNPDQWMLFDVCEVSIGDMVSGHGRNNKARGLVHDCSTVSVQGDKVTVLKMFFGRTKLTDQKTNRISEIKNHARTRKLSPL